MDALLSIIDQIGRAVCFALLLCLLGWLAQGMAERRRIPPNGALNARARAPAREDRQSSGCASDPDTSIPIRDGWRTTRRNRAPEPEVLSLLDLYLFLRRSWNDGWEARQITRGRIAGGTGEPRPKAIVRAARQWAKDTGAGGLAADRLLGQLIAVGVVARTRSADGSGAGGWQLLRPAEASELFVSAVGIGIERGQARRTVAPNGPA
jgi:hypothetical protein